MEASFFTRHPFIKDLISLVIFVICVIVGTILINTYIFRSFNVVGPSMETTMYTGDRLIVNRVPVTWAQIKGKAYIPERGQIIVFKNPHYSLGIEDEYIVKRVIAYPGERVLLADGKYTVFNAEFPAGFNPDDQNNGEPGSPTTDEVDVVVPENELFVSGDHRTGNYSYDSRNGLGTIPFYDVVGPVSVRIFPFNKVRSF
jgi:signal peptidase I